MLKIKVLTVLRSFLINKEFQESGFLWDISPGIAHRQLIIKMPATSLPLEPLSFFPCAASQDHSAEDSSPAIDLDSDLSLSSLLPTPGSIP